MQPASNRYEISWKQATPPLSLNPQDVHLWKCVFQPGIEEFNKFSWLLSEEELKKAARFVYELDRERYIFFHGAIRVILGEYSNSTPNLLSFWKNFYGKPYIVSQDGKDKVQFSLSHSQDIALIAITKNHEIGVDVEFMRVMNDARDIARNYFSYEEQQLLLQLSDEVFNEYFFTCWTQKEAFTKAIGKGFSCPLDSFSVPILKNLRQKCDIKKDLEGESATWLVGSFSPHPGYVGSVVTRPYSGVLSHFQFRVSYEGR